MKIKCFSCRISDLLHLLQTHKIYINNINYDPVTNSPALGGFSTRPPLQPLALLCNLCRVPHLDQVRLSSYSDFEVQTYSLPNILMPAFSSLSLALAGYDFPSTAVLQWRAQISYDDSAHTFQVLMTASNATSYNFMNYFIMAISQEGSAYFAITNVCTFNSYIGLGPFSSYNPNTYVTLQPVGQFYKNNNNMIIGVPFLKSIKSTAPNEISTLTLSPITFVNTTNLVTIRIFNDNVTSLTEVCLTILLYH